MNNDLQLSVGDFVALLNQTLEYAYPNITVTGELANFKVSKNRWVYFDLKDELATIRCFGTVYQLPGPLEDGMLLAVKGVPRLHQQYGFSFNILNIRPVGEGAIKKAAALLEAKLVAEGLFDVNRKRALLYPPRTIGLIASGESAAYRDFVKVIGARWGGLNISHIDVQVQGELAAAQVTVAIDQFNQLADPPDVVVITRGGGSPEDLQAFSTEQVTRAVASSRIPTLVAIGHEVDISLSELAADVRASTPSNAAELLVPDRASLLAALGGHRIRLGHDALKVVHHARDRLLHIQQALEVSVGHSLDVSRQRTSLTRQLLEAFDPARALRRGYALVRKGALLAKAGDLHSGDEVAIELSGGVAKAKITGVRIKQE